jgi:acetyltransferase-like isoleucine patch superfamily enzyme
MHGRLFKGYSFSSNILQAHKIQGHQYIDIKERVYIHSSGWLGAYKTDGILPQLTISDGACLGNFNHISCMRKVLIGKKVLTADHVFITDHLHDYTDPHIPIMDQSLLSKGEVTIGDGTWIGQNVCIIGVSVGKNCVIGANSVVTKDIPDYCVAAGSPAKIIKKYNFETTEWEKYNKD